jgi:hypothetical protein
MSKKKDEELARLKEILKYTVCDKGCGEVLISMKYGSPTCDNCGEELDYDITSAHYEYLKKEYPVVEED